MPPRRQSRTTLPDDEPEHARALDDDLDTDEADLDEALWRPGIPLSQPCPECGGEMEFLATDTSGAVVVYECPDCGMQTEVRASDEEDPYAIAAAFEDEPDEA